MNTRNPAVATGTRPVPATSSRLVAVHAARLFAGWMRSPGMVIQSVLFPAALLVVLDLVFGETVRGMDPGTDPLTRTVPLVAIMGATYGSMAAALSLDEEHESGLLARFWTLPGERSAALRGRLLAEVVRALASTLAVFGVGLVLGLRFHDLPSTLLALLVPSAFVLGATPLLTIVVLRRGGPTAVRHSTGLTLLMSFFNPGIVPVEAFPAWLRPITEYQPMGAAVETMRTLLTGAPMTAAPIWLVGWVLLGLVACGPAAVSAYRRAATA